MKVIPGGGCIFILAHVVVVALRTAGRCYIIWQIPLRVDCISETRLGAGQAVIGAQVVIIALRTGGQFYRNILTYRLHDVPVCNSAIHLGAGRVVIGAQVVVVALCAGGRQECRRAQQRRQQRQVHRSGARHPAPKTLQVLKMTCERILPQRPAVALLAAPTPSQRSAIVRRKKQTGEPVSKEPSFKTPAELPGCVRRVYRGSQQPAEYKSDNAACSGTGAHAAAAAGLAVHAKCRQVEKAGCTRCKRWVLLHRQCRNEAPPCNKQHASAAGCRAAPKFGYRTDVPSHEGATQ